MDENQKNTGNIKGGSDRRYGNMIIYEKLEKVQECISNAHARLTGIEVEQRNTAFDMQDLKRISISTELEIKNILIVQGKQGVFIYLYTGLIAAAISAVFGYFFKK